METSEILESLLQQCSRSRQNIFPIVVNACLSSQLIIGCLSKDNEYARLQYSLIEEYKSNVERERNIVDSVDESKKEKGEIDQNVWVIYTLLPFDLMEIISRQALLIDEIHDENPQNALEYSMAISYLRAARYAAFLLVRQRMSSMNDINIIADIKRRFDDIPVIPAFEWEIK